MIRDHHIIVAQEAESLFETCERRRGLAETALPHDQQRSLIDTHRGGMEQLAAVPLHPPVEQGPQRRRQHPVRQHFGGLNPIDPGLAFVIEHVHRVVMVVERGLDPFAVEPPQVAAIAESFTVAGWRQHGHSGRFAVPQADGGVGCLDARDLEMLEGADEERN